MPRWLASSTLRTAKLTDGVIWVARPIREMSVSKPSVLVTRRMPSSVLSQLAETCEVDCHAETDALSHEALCQRLAGKHGLVCMFNDELDRTALVAAGAQLRVVATVAVGYDNIDVAAAAERGVVVTNTPDILTGATAELTWALILALTRRVGEGDRFVRAGRWEGWTFDSLLGTELRGKQLGIIGPGRIGRAVAAVAPAFGMRPVLSTRGHSLDPSTEIAGSEEEKWMPFDELLSTSAIVSVHVPLRESTRHLIGRRALIRMKRSAFLINTSRGGVVDDEALAWALDERLIAGAALDVFEHEPHVSPALIGRENVCLTPHLGSATRETRVAMAELAVRNVVEVLAGREAVTPVPLPARLLR